MAAKEKNSLAPKLRFKEFKEELLATKFGKVVESNLYGPRFNAEDYSETGNVKTIRGTDLGRDGEIKYDQVPLAKLDENTISNHKLKDGDIVMITTADCGATGVFRKQDIDYLSSAYGVRIRLNDLGYPYYFKYFFQTRLAKREINSFIRKATVANLPGSDILRIKLFLPSLPEQVKIAAFLGAVDEKIQQLTRKKQLLEQYKKGVMQQLFSGKLRFKDDTSTSLSAGNGKAYPKWEVVKLKDIAEPITKGTTPRKFSNNGILFLKIEGLKGLQFEKTKCLFISQETHNTELKRSILKENDILFAIAGSIGKVGIVTKDILPANTNQAFAIIRLKDLKNVPFIIQILNSRKMKKYIFQQVSVGAQPNLNLEQMGNFKFELPTWNEQKKIADFLSAIDAKINKVAEALEVTNQFKKGLLQQMFV